MQSISKNIEHTIIVNKSKFITYLFKINDIATANEYIKQIKSKHSDATHNCYAYVFENIKRFCDDQEPKYTAGRPILNVLVKNDLNYVLCIVSRYFGGIKLGIGGLKRAYAKSARECLKKAKIVKLITGKRLEIAFSYQIEGKIRGIIKDKQIITKKYDHMVIYQVIVSDNVLLKLKELNIKIKIISDLYVEME